MPWVLVLTILAGCGQPAAPTPPPAPAPATPTAPAAPPPAPPPSVHVATFADDQLSECVDAVLEVAESDRAAAETALARFNAAEGAVRVTSPCDVQFSDRTIYATCQLAPVQTAAAKVPMPAGTLRLTSTWFNPRVLEDDGPMRECLQGGGDWTAIDRNSPEAQSGLLHYHALKARQAADEARRLLRR